MARGINRVIIIGNCGSDPETKHFPDGGSVTNVTVATSESWKDKTTGEQKEKTEWHRVVFRDRGNFKLGEIAGQYLKKGSKIYVEGKLQTRDWEQDGVKRYTTEIIASEMQMLDSKADSQQSLAQQQAEGEHAQQPQRQAQGARAGQQTHTHQGQAGVQQHATPNQQATPQAGYSDFDSDIPFAPVEF